MINNKSKCRLKFESAFFNIFPQEISAPVANQLTSSTAGGGRGAEDNRINIYIFYFKKNLTAFS